mmetsp:Transcript_34432/g.56806  ORF Transcript_34432/g.56806 Transcript_34432/m.56806 type:complete len:240 (+) Transcript_34432:114-833(+)
MGNKLPNPRGFRSKSREGSRRNSEANSPTPPAPRMEPPPGMDSNEVTTLWHLFNTIAVNGVISRTAFAEQCDFLNSQMMERAFVAFDGDRDGVIGFEEFLVGMNFLNSKAPPSIKIPFLFRAYDWDGDGALSRADITAMLGANALENGLVLTEAQVAEVVRYTFEDLNPRDPESISYAEFERMVEAKPRLVSPSAINASKSFGKILVLGATLGGGGGGGTAQAGQGSMMPPPPGTEARA